MPRRRTPSRCSHRTKCGSHSEPPRHLRNGWRRTSRVVAFVKIGWLRGRYPSCYRGTRKWSKRLDSTAPEKSSTANLISTGNGAGGWSRFSRRGSSSDGRKTSWRRQSSSTELAAWLSTAMFNRRCRFPWDGLRTLDADPLVSGSVESAAFHSPHACRQRRKLTALRFVPEPGVRSSFAGIPDRASLQERIGKSAGFHAARRNPMSISVAHRCSLESGQIWPRPSVSSPIEMVALGTTKELAT
jgi:hypothetical protein